jgi:hypothetical protein
MSVLPALISTDQRYFISKQYYSHRPHSHKGFYRLRQSEGSAACSFICQSCLCHYFVEHHFIYQVLEKFGFGVTFRRSIRTVYGSARKVAKINCTLTAHFKIFFLDFPTYLQSVELHSANGVLGSEGG